MSLSVGYIDADDPFVTRPPAPSMDWYDGDHLVLSQARAIRQAQENLRANSALLERAKQDTEETIQPGSSYAILLDEMDALLLHQETMLDLISSKKAKIRAILAENPHPPVAPGIAILEKSVCGALRKIREDDILIDHLKPDLDGLRGWSHSRDTTATPSQHGQSQRFQDYHDISTDGTPDEHTSAHFPDTRAKHIDSRRLMFRDLPKGITLSQVLRGVRCDSTVLHATLLDIQGLKPSTTALVELVQPASAAKFALGASQSPVIYMDEHGESHQADVSLVPTNSYCYSYTTRHLLKTTATRSLRIENFPTTGIWFFLCAIGTRHIVDVYYNKETSALLVDFSSVFEANKMRYQVHQFRNCSFIYRDIIHSFASDPAEMLSPANELRPRKPVPYVHPNFLENIWNRSPYNQFWPTAQLYVMKPQCLKPRDPPCPRLLKVKSLVQPFEIPEEVVAASLRKHRQIKGSEYNIVESAIDLIQCHLGSEIQEDDCVHLLANYHLQESGLEADWDAYFASRGLINIRLWEKYGKLASHRREVASSQGLETWEIPQCQNCSIGCSPLAAAPVPEVIGQYLKSTIIHEEEEYEDEDLDF
ncbi:hypothetical protein B0I35DRAFT_480922 [Stachybotrys elegans]|uniref:Uncharacterized protein n=1 Tax=Stachybotrys elegans TaxID=80388 RepID=A0A8K0WPR3_9HYPO|nr:hypothetical protein B0I35DRAFT_480922 [Stachybotrys elegans]